jgi:hypothetical protein
VLIGGLYVKTIVAAVAQWQKQAGMVDQRL